MVITVIYKSFVIITQKKSLSIPPQARDPVLASSCDRCDRTARSASNVQLSLALCLESRGEGIQLYDGILSSSEASILLLEGSGQVSLLDSQEEGGSGLLLLSGLSESADSSTGLVHVTLELITDIEPLLALDVLRKKTETNLGLSDDGQFALLVGSSTCVIQ